MAVVDCTIVGPLAGTNTLAAYAIYPSPTASQARQAPSRLVLINYNATGSVVFQFNANTTGIDPTSGTQPNYGSATLKYLKADTVNSGLDINWGGQVVTGGGVLSGDYITTSVDGCGSSTGCALSVPGPGVAIVYLDGQIAASNGPSTSSSNSTSTDSGTNVSSSSGAAAATGTSVDPGLFPSKADIRAGIDLRVAALVLLFGAFIM